MTKFNKFDRKVKDTIVAPHIRSVSQPGVGVVITYEPSDNTATVLMSQPNSSAAGEIYNKVPCPTTMGVQGVAPEPGRQCMVMFKNGNSENPVILTFFNYQYEQFDHAKQNSAPAPLPYFMRSM